MLQDIQSKVRKACEIYRLIEDGDRVAVGVSGGKDSVALLAALAGLRRYYPKRFTLTAITLDPCFDNTPADYGPIEALCESLEVPYILKRTNIGDVIFNRREEKNPCSLCARMRRGALHDLCVENGLNKLALGHHMDDVVETFFLNLFHEGRIGAFSPNTYLSRKNIHMIRPMVLCTEQEVRNACLRDKLPVVKSACPMDGVSERQTVKEFIAERETVYPGFLRRTFTAMQGADISGFAPRKDEDETDA